ncbi:hypothetical protein Patl1_15571 [Pistacia atlantica]|uniref:Uncharacterized protein n=1 Tax=Pistacia atlantica TaxID=434234 RepID=A0ACC1B5R3_9ROSI|nr:hypothetical protein Patl1_15571 [Pistacia atlantica]
MVIVAKNPCLHLGDVRVLKVVDVPTLYHMVDYKIFPAKGKWMEISTLFVGIVISFLLANISPYKAMCWQCILLAKLASIAVDFSKIKVPTKIPQHLQVQDLVPKMGTIKSFTSDEARQFYDLDIEVKGFKDYIDDAFYYKHYFGISTEGEILSGQIMKMAKSFRKKRDLEGIKLIVKSLIKEAREWFNKMENVSDGLEKVFIKASTWYYVTYHPSFWGRYNEGLNCEHFLSFPWCVHDKLLEIKRDRQRILRALHHSSLQA